MGHEGNHCLRGTGTTDCAHASNVQASDCQLHVLTSPVARHHRHDIYDHIGGSTRDGYKGILTLRAALSRTNTLLDELMHCRAQAVPGCPGSRSAALLCLLPLPNSCTAFMVRPLQDEQTRGVPLPVREVVFDSIDLTAKVESKVVDREWLTTGVCTVFVLAWSSGTRPRHESTSDANA